MARGAIALLYFGTMTLAPVGDAWLEATTPEGESHVETASDSSCRSGHDELFCQLCRLLELSTAPTSRPVLATLGLRRQRGPNTDPGIGPERPVSAWHAARAPPSL